MLPTFSDSGQLHARRGKLVPVTTWHWVPESDNDRNLQLDPTAPTITHNHAHAPQDAFRTSHTALHSQRLEPSLAPDNYYYARNAGSSIPASTSPPQALLPYAQHASTIEFPQYHQAFAIPPSAPPVPGITYQPAPSSRLDGNGTAFYKPPTFRSVWDPTWLSKEASDSDLLPDVLDESQVASSQGISWDAAIQSTIPGIDVLQPPDIEPIENSSLLYNDATYLGLNQGQHVEPFNAELESLVDERTINALPTYQVLTEDTTPVPSLITPNTTPESHLTPSSDLICQTKADRKRARSPGTELNRKLMQLEDGKAQGLQLSWQGTTVAKRKLDSVQKAERKRKILMGTCPRCKRLKQKCEGFKDSPYLPCISCRVSNPTSITNACILEASLLGIMLFRMGPPVDNPSHPLNFLAHRNDLLHGLTDGRIEHETRDLELVQDNVGIPLHLQVTRYCSLPGDKTAYEGIGDNGPYKLDMPPYCISDTRMAARSIVAYMRKAKGTYFNCFMDRNNALLFHTFRIAAMCDVKERPLIRQALDIWAATRLIERTWKLSGSDTLGIHPFHNRSDPWKGFVPVTPIMDQQLDQIVIREILVPRRNKVLADLKIKVYQEGDTKLHAFEVYLTFFILLNNAEMQLAAEREFAQRYGFSGRFGPRGKYMDADAQFHAARTMLGHFHYICRANCLLTTSPKLLKELGLGAHERKYLEDVRKEVEKQKSHFSTLIKEHRYESAMYFCHQMLSDRWNAGHGYIEEIHEDAEEGESSQVVA